MDKNKELVKNTMIITIGKIATQFIGFLLLPLYTALLSTEEYGTVDLINTYAQLLIPVVTLQMDQALLRYIIKERYSYCERKKYLSTACVILVTQIILFSILFFSVTRFINNSFLIYLYANVVAIGFSSYMLQTSRGLGDNISYSTSSFICGALTIILNVFFISVLKMKTEGMLLATVIGNLVSAFYIFFKKNVFKYVSLDFFKFDILRKMISYAWPLIPNALIWWIVNASDRSIVLLFLGTSANGILAVSHKFPSLIMTLYNIFHLSWTESAAMHLNKRDKDVFFSSVFNMVFRVFSAICIMLIASMPFLFEVFINESYKEAYYYIPIYTLASLFNVVVGLYSVVYISNMKTREIAKTSLLAGLINVSLNVALIKVIGLYAAPVSSVVAFGTMAIYRMKDVRKYIKQKIDPLMLLFVAVIFLLGVVLYYQPLYIFHIIYLLCATSFSIFVNRGLCEKAIVCIKEIIMKGKKK